MSDGGKGDKRRPEDLEKFSDGYDRIFGSDNKPKRGKFIWDENLKKFIPQEEWAGSSSNEPSYYVQGDISPYRSMVTGEMVESRSRHRQILREHRLIEVGNETKYLKQKPRDPAPGRKEMLVALANEKLR